MDKATFTAFNQLWNLYKISTDRADYQNPDFWDKLVSDAERITKDADGAGDPEFINDFAVAVLDSIERLSKKNN